MQHRKRFLNLFSSFYTCQGRLGFPIDVHVVAILKRVPDLLGAVCTIPGGTEDLHLPGLVLVLDIQFPGGRSGMISLFVGREEGNRLFRGLLGIIPKLFGQEIESPCRRLVCIIRDGLLDAEFLNNSNQAEY
ncbi:hypothetical protein ASPZODRAFT_1503783 [Penicilliopsis zonata CBS 506.65]|uniref:Uncharacterized protein n=1 Tax=Penicilliopsis zonata CBS 506.65 TaxID=1073090 RepID=A0A1L9S4W9_9EURO|nr:hypothetical protein ASPZODRAFT_1503783 [Penicilliopsis zonata CBS 506.65]OJJ42196.1 hypothetical protein ASPZODRAFT_1503783 [Penicilliopsis zonata CBS 506.65]